MSCEAAAWARSGAMALTGDGKGPPLAPSTRAAAMVDEVVGALGLDARVLSERAALMGLRRRGPVSCGGASRLLRTTDGWLVLSLPRREDVELLPALLRTAVGDDPWRAVAEAAAGRPAAELSADAVALGMAAGELGEARCAPFASTGAGRPGPGTPEAAPLVIDMSALWAGPLCGDLLRRTGARVVKVESSARPDGARLGDRRFFDLLNGGKESVVLDLATSRGRDLLGALVDAGDIVLSSSRARAVLGLGIDPQTFLSGGTDRVWVAVTGHGWANDRVGFGDDAAATAGLVAWGHDDAPRFVADAVADPLCGVLAFEAALTAWRTGGRWFVDASLAGAAARVSTGGIRAPARPATRTATGWELDGTPVALPRPRLPEVPAAALGADAASVLAELGR